MRMTVLFGSPRGAESNTRALLMPLLETWRQAGHAAEIYDLYDLKIEGCRACLGCQQDWEAPACVLDDDMQPIFDSILRSDLTLLATPIYSWYCTPPMKAVLDRLVYGMNKYYGREKGPSLWEGKPVALIATCGYPVEKGADLWEAGMQRYCKHSRLRLLGMLAQRHRGYDTVFMDPEKARLAAEFARKVNESI